MEKKKKRYSVLTYIFDGYEKVHEIIEKDEDAEYILVTDDPELVSDTWTVVTDEKLDGLSVFDKCYQVRFHPFDYVNTDTCFRIDGSVEIKSSLAPIVDKFDEGGYDVLLMHHPRRNSLVDEYNTWIRTRDYDTENAVKILNGLANLGWSINDHGLYEFTVCLMRDNKMNRDMNNITYDLLKYFGKDGEIERLDQTVYSYVVDKFGRYAGIKVLLTDETLITDSRYFQWYMHNSNTKIGKIGYRGYLCQQFLLGQPVEPVKIE